MSEEKYPDLSPAQQREKQVLQQGYEKLQRLQETYHSESRFYSAAQQMQIENLLDQTSRDLSFLGASASLGNFASVQQRFEKSLSDVEKLILQHPEILVGHRQMTEDGQAPSIDDVTKTGGGGEKKVVSEPAGQKELLDVLESRIPTLKEAVGEQRGMGYFSLTVPLSMDVQRILTGDDGFKIDDVIARSVREFVPLEDKNIKIMIVAEDMGDPNAWRTMKDVHGGIKWGMTQYCLRFFTPDEALAATFALRNQKLPCKASFVEFPLDRQLSGNPDKGMWLGDYGDSLFLKQKDAKFSKLESSPRLENGYVKKGICYVFVVMTDKELEAK